MIDLFVPARFLTWAVCFVGGLGFGLAYFRCLRTTTNLILRDGNPLLGLALTLGRLVVLGICLFVAVQAGGVALLVALAGILCAKTWMLRHSLEATHELTS